MEAVIVSKIGGPEVLKLADSPKPKIEPTQLLVKVAAAGVNRADILQRKGKYPPPQGITDILGLEIAGEVVQTGKDTNRFKVGDRIFGLVSGGGYGEYCAIDETLAMKIPAKWSYIEAAAVPEVFIAANEILFELAELQPQQAILIHAGGSGVGTAIIQMAKHNQSQVYFTAGTDEKITKGVELGAIAGINYHQQDFAVEIMRLTENVGIDVVVDFIGANYFTRNISVLKPNGKLIQVAMMSGSKCEIDLQVLVSKHLQIKGFIMRSRLLEEKAKFTARFAKKWLPILNKGEIKPIIDSVFPVSEARLAHQYMEENKNFGKIVLSWE